MQKKKKSATCFVGNLIGGYNIVLVCVVLYVQRNTQS